MKKRVLVFYITGHSGHYRAAKSIEAALKRRDPDCEVMAIDAMSFYHPVSSRIIDKMYYFAIKKAPYLWGGMYDRKMVRETLSPLEKLIHEFNYTKTQKLLKKFPPDAIICTQAFPCGIVAHFKRKTGSRVPLYGVVTDFWPHRFWFYKEVDYYTVATPWAKRRFQEFGIEEEKMKVFGIPVHPDFSDHVDRLQARAQLGLDDDDPVVMVMGGGSGLGPIKSIVKHIDESSVRCQAVVICGKNEKLYKSLIGRSYKKNISVLGYSDDVYKVMTAADFIVTKAGGITLSESLAKKLVTIIISSLPGQENFNARYLLRNRMAVRVKRPADVIRRMHELMADPARLQLIREKVEAVSRPNSSLDIADFVLRNISRIKNSNIHV